MYATPGVRFGLTSGHEKAAFVKARARDREVAQRSSLGSSVARHSGKRLGTAPTSWVSCSVATEDCVPRCRLPVTDLVTKTVNTHDILFFFTALLFGTLSSPAGCGFLCPLLQPRLRNPTTRNFPHPGGRAAAWHGCVVHTYLPLAPTHAPTTPQRRPRRALLTTYVRSLQTADNAAAISK